MRLVQSLPDEADCLLVAEGVPQAVRGQDHELGLQLVQVKGHDVGIWDNHVEVFQRVVAQGARHGKDALDAPRTVETDEAACEKKQDERSNRKSGRRGGTGAGKLINILAVI